jgi:hypothetical protein
MRKTMSVNEFVEQGFLQEVNRLFFHPRGLALSVWEDDDGNHTLLNIWDSRDDLEGIAFADECLNSPEAIEKVKIVEAEFQKHIEARKALFNSNSTIQEIK